MLFLAGCVVALAEGPPERVDYMSFAQGVVPLTVSGEGAELGAGFEEAVRAIDGDANGYTLTSKPGAGGETVFVYALPAATTFDRFAIPNVLETPSPGETFVRRVEIHGSTGPDAAWQPLAAGTLTTHASKGQVTELAVTSRAAVRRVQVTVSGGIEMARPTMFVEFSELVGNGQQEVVPLDTRFAGTWRQTGFALELEQRGPLVSGCYDRTGELSGTVSGNVLRATGVGRDDGVRSAFVLVIAPDGAIRGVRSTNGAPFRLWTGPPAPVGTAAGCKPTPAPAVGCGSILHGIGFDYDSATIRPESTPVLAELYAGLSEDAAASIVIEGHTSSEGSDVYNQSLSERRAKSVVDDLVRRGIPASRLSASGVGEARPLADNDTEAGRVLNRRVEVRCK
jgi:outer membrane protein OmpA-like peptidoglycan-associated protein